MATMAKAESRSKALPRGKALVAYACEYLSVL